MPIRGAKFIKKKIKYKNKAKYPDFKVVKYCKYFTKNEFVRERR